MVFTALPFGYCPQNQESVLIAASLIDCDNSSGTRSYNVNGLGCGDIKSPMAIEETSESGTGQYQPVLSKASALIGKIPSISKAAKMNSKIFCILFMLNILSRSISLYSILL